MWTRVRLQQFVHLRLEGVACVGTQVRPNVAERTVPQRHVELVVGGKENFFLVMALHEFCVSGQEGEEGAAMIGVREHQSSNPGKSLDGWEDFKFGVVERF